MAARGRMGRCGGIAIGLMVLLAFGGCQEQESDGGAGRQMDADGPEVERVTGTVRHVDLEGGFYGIETDDGRKLDPVNLPEEIRQDGLRIEARVEVLRDRVSIRMWGTLVRIVEFKRL
jgi:hypothetical protein